MDNNNIDFGDEIIGWQVPEFEKHERSRRWYIIGSLAGIALVIYSILTSNFLFAVIIVLGAFILIMNDGRNPENIKFSITDEGLVVGKKFIDFDEIKNFSVVYKPRLGVKNIYFEFKNALRHRISIPLGDMNPLPIRETLLKYVKEDLDRTDQPLSEGLAKLFKL